MALAGALSRARTSFWGDRTGVAFAADVYLAREMMHLIKDTGED